MNLTWDNNLGSSHNSCAQDMTLLLGLIKEFDPGDILMSSFSNFTTISEEATFILNEIHKRFDAESKNVDRNQFMRLVIKCLSWRAMASNLPNALSDSGVNQETPPFEITQPIQENVGYEGGGVDGMTYETENQCQDEIQDAAAYDCLGYSEVTTLTLKKYENGDVVVTGVTAEEHLNGADDAYCTEVIQQAQGNHYVSSAPMIVTSSPNQV